MSKIFEALQRAQQQLSPEVNPGAAKGVALETPAEASLTPSAVDSDPPAPLWQPTPSIPAAPQGLFYSDAPAIPPPPAPAPTDALFSSPGVSAFPSAVPPFPSSAPYSAPLPPSPFPGTPLPPPPAFGSAPYAAPPFQSAYPPAGFPGPSAFAAPAPPAFTAVTPAYDAPMHDAELSGYGSPIPAPSLPMPQQGEVAPAVWEPPSIVRFAPRSKVVVAQNPTSLAAEQYRVLRTNIIKLSQTQALKVILITSPGPGDGKTLTTMNLALSFCQKPDTRVLLIEADLRKPSVGALVAMDPGPGLADYLAGEASLEQVVRPTSIPNFHLLDSGKQSQTPADLLHSPRLGSMMEVLRSHFNWIVLDGPPTNPVADYELLTPICDGVVLVVRPFYTQRDLLRLTTEALRGRKVLGCVVNGSKHFERYGSAYGYGYGYGPGNNAEPSAPQKKKMKRGKKSKFSGYAG